jgi:hypothetical protein
MFHRHVTLERYELAVEEDPKSAAEMEAAAKGCPICQRELSQASLGDALDTWTLPADVEAPVDWRQALRRAVAPSLQPAAQRRSHRWRLGAVLALFAALMLIATVPVAATAGPDSALFRVRGVEEDARWRLTPESNRPNLEADLALAYLWEARVSAGRRDTAGYQASMERFFEWADRLRSDVRKAPAAERPKVRQDVSAARLLVASLAASGSDASGNAQRADSILQDVQGESQEGNGEHQGSQPGVGPGSNGDRWPPNPVVSQTPKNPNEPGSTGVQGQWQEGNGAFPGHG